MRSHPNISFVRLGNFIKLFKMKSIKLSLIALILTCIFMSSCEKEKLCTNGEGPVVTQTLNVADFSAIDLAGASNVTITEGEIQEVKAIGQANIISRVKTDVSGGKWKIDMEKGCYEDYELTIAITTPKIEGVKISGHGDVSIYGFENVTVLEVSISGNGNVIANEAFPGLQKLDISISGSGEVLGFPMVAKECEINVPGTGKIEVSVTEKLNVNISGSAKVYYKGSCTITQKITGSGEIINAN